MKGRHSQRRRFSLQPLCIIRSPTSEEEFNGQSDLPDAKEERRVHEKKESKMVRSPPPAPEPTTPAKSHYKVVVLGSARVGKTSLVGQFLYAAFSPRYRPTVDDMHTVELDCNGLNLRLDILDTGGSYAFPAMRALSIKGADGFILVCAADEINSLEEVESARTQIIEVKGKSVPIVVVVNKTDLICSQPTSHSTNKDKEIPNGTHKANPFLCIEMVESLVTCDWGHGFVAASAKDNVNVVQVFQELFIQAKSRIALSPAVRKRRQSLPSRVFLPNSPQLSHLHNLSLQTSMPPSHKTTVKRNSCTVS